MPYKTSHKAPEGEPQIPMESFPSQGGIGDYLTGPGIQSTQFQNYSPLGEGIATLTYTIQQGGVLYTIQATGPAEQVYGSLTSSLLPFAQNYLLAPKGDLTDIGGLEDTLTKTPAPKEQIIFSPSDFTTTPTPKANNLEELDPFIKEAFKKTTGNDLPKNISIALCSKEELKQAHNFYGGEWNENIQGFCINNPKSTSHIFVKEGEIAHVLLTIGHELGHLQSAPLAGIEEEAKAYAFSMAWMRVIREENIANLQNVLIVDNPARNGLHNAAFDFVCSMLKSGKEALEVFDNLVNGLRIETFI